MLNNQRFMEVLPSLRTLSRTQTNNIRSNTRMHTHSDILLLL